MAFFYEVTDCQRVFGTINIETETELDFSKVYRFSGPKGLEDWCFQVLREVDGETEPVTVFAVFDSCELCLGEDPSKTAEVITEDDVSVKVTKTMTQNEKLISIRSKVVIRNGSEQHTLTSYSIALPDTYFNGYLVASESVQMPWAVNFPDTAVNNFATVETSSDQLTVRLPNLINWRYFQSLPQLSVIFGTNATRNWLWYQQNGWEVINIIETQNEVGVYIDELPLVIRDYDDNINIDWYWEFYRLSDNAQVNAPIAGEKVRVFIKGTQSGTTQPIDYATVTVEGIEQNIRWLISSIYDQNGQANSPLSTIVGETKLKADINPSDFELQFIFDPTKIQGQNGVKFTARSYSNDGYSERNIAEFPIARIPVLPLKDEYETDCCECEPEKKLASSTSESLLQNDITGIAHKNQTPGDTCEFKIFKGGVQLPNNGVDYPNGFPHDPNVSAFIFNWKYYLLNHGQGCYKIEKHFTVSGLPFVEELGKYELFEYSAENAQGSVRVLYQNNFQTLWEDSTINYTDSGFEDSYRFRGMFGNWQPNVQSESNFSVLNENRVASIKSKDTYILNHFHATECHIKRLHKIVMHATIWRMSDHNPSNTLQEKKIFECVLDPEAKEDITYNPGSRVTGIEIVLSKRQQNSVSLFAGSIQVPQGATWFLPTVTGSGGSCLPSPISIAGTYISDLPSGDSLNIITTDQNGLPITPISGTVSGGVATVVLSDEVYNIYVDGILNTTFTAQAMEDLTINITA